MCYYCNERDVINAKLGEKIKGLEQDRQRVTDMYEAAQGTIRDLKAENRELVQELFKILQKE